MLALIQPSDQGFFSSNLHFRTRTSFQDQDLSCSLSPGLEGTEGKRCSSRWEGKKQSPHTMRLAITDRGCGTLSSL